MALVENMSTQQKTAQTDEREDTDHSSYASQHRLEEVN